MASGKPGPRPWRREVVRRISRRRTLTELGSRYAPSWSFRDSRLLCLLSEHPHLSRTQNPAVLGEGGFGEPRVVRCRAVHAGDSPPAALDARGRNPRDAPGAASWRACGRRRFAATDVIRKGAHLPAVAGLPCARFWASSLAARRTGRRTPDAGPRLRRHARCSLSEPAVRSAPSSAASLLERLSPDQAPPQDVMQARSDADRQAGRLAGTLNRG